mmetsp:Transcript_69967/g.211665  ORF Transcript_69967/g.211665 Transcript_69967/m.211665 type:complete len:170 (+) Transcript_69967:114-623(+)
MSRLRPSTLEDVQRRVGPLEARELCSGAPSSSARPCGSSGSTRCACYRRLRVRLVDSIRMLTSDGWRCPAFAAMDVAAGPIAVGSADVATCTDDELFFCAKEKKKKEKKESRHRQSREDRWYEDFDHPWSDYYPHGTRFAVCNKCFVGDAIPYTGAPCPYCGEVPHPLS